MSTRVLGIVLLLLILPVPGAAQGAASLDEVEALVDQGRILEARQVLERWWDGQGASVGRMDRQRSLWLRARLTVDPSMAELDLRRLVLEFPGGLYSDDALLRLAQSADLRGDLRQAHAQFTALLRGYPASPHAPSAEAWVRENGSAVEALGPAPDPAPGSFSSPVGGERGGMSVQLGAFRSMDGALALAGRARAAGYEPRVVRISGKDLIRVRVGRFEDRAAVESLKRELERVGFEATIATDAQAEERVG